jgi:uncharacterized protein DUF6256
MGLLLHMREALLAQGVAGAEPTGLSDIVRHDVIPVAAAFVVFLGLLIAYHRTTRPPDSRAARHRNGIRRSRERERARPGTGWGDLIRHLLSTVTGGYLVFLTIVVVFYFVLGGEDLDFIRQALVEGSLLAFVLVIPAFLILAKIADELSRRRGDGGSTGAARS